MPKIKCDVKNCTYNYETKCTRKNIDVESMQALVKDETYCESFVPKSNMTMNYEFASFDGKTKPSTDVYCNVVNCVYEKNQKCCADHINIQNSNIKCKYDTEFSKELGAQKQSADVCKDTKCNTFEPVEY